jgi:hypothetical protein
MITYILFVSVKVAFKNYQLKGSILVDIRNIYGHTAEKAHDNKIGSVTR